MRKRTTTQKLQDAIANNLLTITKAECHYKSSNHIDEISADKFKDSFDFLCESGVFAEAIGWHYERDHKSESYILETGRYNPHSENIVIVYMSVANGVSSENIERTLLFTEEE